MNWVVVSSYIQTAFFLVQHIICVSQHPFSSGSPQVVDIALVRDSAWMSWFNCWTAITHSLRGFFTMPCAIRFEDKLLSEGFCKAPTTILTFDVIPRVFWQRRSSLQYCLYTSWIQPSNSSQLCTKKTARKSSTTILFETRYLSIILAFLRLVREAAFDLMRSPRCMAALWEMKHQCL